jgi:hypothetical protein
MGAQEKPRESRQLGASYELMHRSNYCATRSPSSAFASSVDPMLRPSDNN